MIDVPLTVGPLGPETRGEAAIDPYRDKLNILSLGAGVQSSTLALMGAYGVVDPFDHAIFADTQSEPAGVYSWLATLRELIAEAPHPFPIHVVTAGNLTDDMLKLRTSKKTGQKYVRALIPAYFQKPDSKHGRGLLGRKCTAEYKVRALIRKQRELAKVPRARKGVDIGVRCRVAIGISWDEVERMKPSTEPWAVNYWPLVERKLTRQDCLDWMELMGFPKPPRSACVFCPFHSDAEWRRLRDEEPTEFQRAVRVDRELRAKAAQSTGTAKLAGDVFLHASLKPLDQVDFGDLPDHAQASQFGNDCTGLCGV